MNVNPHPYDALTPDAVLNAVESIGLLTDARILALNSYENRVYQIGIEEDAPVITKFYRPQRWTREQILEEHQFVLELEALEIPVVAPMTINGNTLFDYQGFMFSVYPRRGGRTPELEDLDNLFAIGRYIGRMHACGAVRPFIYRPTMNVVDEATASSRYLLANDFIPKDLRPAYETTSDDLIERMQQSLAPHKNLLNIRLHGDCHASNILWRDECHYFVDFDDCKTGPAIQDLWLLLWGERPTRIRLIAELLEGYREFHDFNPVELQLIETLRTLRIMNYSAWLAKRWSDPAFPRHFPWFNTERYWSEHILQLREQQSAMQEEPLVLLG
ncbi:MAG: serine/threonine protein kinase [Gammaproteobacteria bacterium]|nr:MAG: serine/threonine protein kinase [Gammaproteobacteria bacterium]